MQEKLKKHPFGSFPDQNRLAHRKLPQSPINYLRANFKKSLERAIGSKISKEIEGIITVDLTPNHIEGDFTFPVFEIAKLLKMEYTKLASDTANHLRSQKKYIQAVTIVNGYINVTINPKTFYRDSLQYVLNEKLLRETTGSKKIRTVLLISGDVKANAPVNRFVSQFINHLYALPPYVVKAVVIESYAPSHKTRSLLRKVIKMGLAKDFGNNVIAIPLQQEKYALLQRQDKTPTALLHQLTSLAVHIKQNSPSLVILSLNIAPQSTREFLAAAHRLGIFKDSMRILDMDDSIMENKMNSHHIESIQSLQKEIHKILQNNQAIQSKISIRFKDSEMVLARLISYAPEVFRRSLTQASPQAISKYAETCENPVYEYYKSVSTNSSLKTSKISQDLLLSAIYKIFDTCLTLIAK